MKIVVFLVFIFSFTFFYQIKAITKIRLRKVYQTSILTVVQNMTVTDCVLLCRSKSFCANVGYKKKLNGFQVDCYIWKIDRNDIQVGEYVMLYGTENMENKNGEKTATSVDGTTAVTNKVPKAISNYFTESKSVQTTKITTSGNSKTTTHESLVSIEQTTTDSRITTTTDDRIATTTNSITIQGFSSATTPALENITTYEKNACEYKEMTILCPNNTYINISYALYGRETDDVETCFKADCSSPTTLGYAQSTCDTKQNCTLNANNYNSGGGTNPCPVFTPKYLLVEYQCVITLGVPLHETKEKTACENQQLSIECPSDTEISITRAMYGRETGSYPICLQVSCSAPVAYLYARSECQAKTSCNLKSTNPVSAHGKDPCPSTLKYLITKYQCLSYDHISIRSPQKKLVCEGSAMNIVCPHELRIKIISALYGRETDDYTYCASVGILGVNCTSAGTFTMVQNQCNNNSTCEVIVSNSLNGGLDPCSGTKKYLLLVYECVV